MIIAFTGAGISQESGIPTFEKQPELRNKLTRDYANDYPEEYNRVIRELKEKIKDAKSNDAHIALAEYHIPVITMNVDGLLFSKRKAHSFKGGMDSVKCR